MASGLDGQRQDTLRARRRRFSEQGPKYDHARTRRRSGTRRLGGGPASGADAFLAPTAGLIRSARPGVSRVPEAAQDFLTAWNASTGVFQPGYPVPGNDLQFLTGPSVGNVDPRSPETRRSAARASLDLNAVNGAGVEPASGFPKLSSDWMVTNPVIGSFGGARDGPGDAQRGGRDDRGGARCSHTTPRRRQCPARLVAALPSRQRELGRPCARDAVSPGRRPARRCWAASLTFKAPGDDLLCGTLAAGEKGARYEAVQSTAPITAANFAAAEKIDAPATGASPGTAQALAIPAHPKRYLAIRAVDEQGNVRPAAGHPRAKADGRPRGLSPHSTSNSSSAFWAWRRFSAWSQMRWRVP